MNKQVIPKLLPTTSNGYLEKLAGASKKSKQKITEVIENRLSQNVPLTEVEKESIKNPPSPVAVKFSDLSGYIKKISL